MERIIVSAQSIDQRLVGAGGKRDPEVAWSVGHPVDLQRDAGPPTLAAVPPKKRGLALCCDMVTGSMEVDLPAGIQNGALVGALRSEEHTSELQSLMRISYAVF